MPTINTKASHPPWKQERKPFGRMRVDNSCPRRTRIWFAGVLVLLGLSWWFSGCKEIDPPLTLEERLQGVWIGGFWGHETNRYCFQEATMWTQVYNSGQLTNRRDYVYTTAGDTLKAVDIASLERFLFVVEFESDTMATMQNGGLVLNLVKIK